MKFNRVEEIHDYIIFHPATAEKTEDGGWYGASIEMTPYIQEYMQQGRIVDDPVPYDAVGFYLRIQHHDNHFLYVFEGQGRTLMEAYEMLLKDIELFEAEKEE